MRRRSIRVAVLALLLVSTAGCDYGAAVVQNLGWGVGGLVQSVLVNGDLSGAFSWISGALVNGAIYGHQ
jgi:hypothetical protein